jgi:hypothetical protein
VARRINSYLGGAVVAPWEISELPDDWLEAINGLTIDLPEINAGQAQVDSILSEWRKKWQNQS